MYLFGYLNNVICCSWCMNFVKLLYSNVLILYILILKSIWKFEKLKFLYNTRTFCGSLGPTIVLCLLLYINDVICASSALTFSLFKAINKAYGSYQCTQSLLTVVDSCLVSYSVSWAHSTTMTEILLFYTHFIKKRTNYFKREKW